MWTPPHALENWDPHHCICYRAIHATSLLGTSTPTVTVVVFCMSFRTALVRAYYVISRRTHKIRNNIQCALLRFSFQNSSIISWPKQCPSSSFRTSSLRSSNNNVFVLSTKVEEIFGLWNWFSEFNIIIPSHYRHHLAQRPSLLPQRASFQGIINHAKIHFIAAAHQISRNSGPSQFCPLSASSTSRYTITI